MSKKSEAIAQAIQDAFDGAIIISPNEIVSMAMPRIRQIVGEDEPGDGLLEFGRGERNGEEYIYEAKSKIVVAKRPTYCFCDAERRRYFEKLYTQANAAANAPEPPPLKSEQETIEEYWRRYSAWVLGEYRPWYAKRGQLKGPRT